MRIVLDNNVIVSGLLSETSVPAQVVELCIAGQVDVVVDGRILSEYRAVLSRREFGFEPADVAAFLAVLEGAERVVGVPLPLLFPDRGDLPFIECAVAGAVDAIVTGNTKHFRPKEGRLIIAVLTPRQCLERVAGGA